MTTDRLEYPVNTLVSFHYFKRVPLDGFAAGGLRMIGDSGAYSAANLGAPVDLGEFAAWAQRWREQLAWIASLDAIGDAERSWRNYRTLRDRYELDVVPTVHYGSAPELLDRYADDGVDMVGLGGMVGRKGQPRHLMRWCLSMFRYARDHHPEMRFHGWGVTHTMLVDSLPWYSVDSSGAGAAYRYGRAGLYCPDTRKLVQVRMDGRDAYRHAQLLRRHYGLKPSDVAYSKPETLRALVRAAGRSFQLREKALRAKFHVTPPSYGQTSPQVGPNVHMVDAAPKNLSYLARPGAVPDSKEPANA